MTACGHEVTVTDDGDSELELAATGDYVILYTDLRNPLLNVREYLCEQRRSLPQDESQDKSSNADTVRGDTLTFLETLDRPYLHKPFSLSELRTLLAAIPAPADSPAQ